jgi:hypothetical protein
LDLVQAGVLFIFAALGLGPAFPCVVRAAADSGGTQEGATTTH